MCYPLKQNCGFPLSFSLTGQKSQQLEQEKSQPNAKKTVIAKYLVDSENWGGHYMSQFALQICFICGQEENEGIWRLFTNTVLLASALFSSMNKQKNAKAGLRIVQDEKKEAFVKIWSKITYTSKINFSRKNMLPDIQSSDN